MMGTFAYFSMLSLPYSIVGLALTSKGIPCSLTACLRNRMTQMIREIAGRFFNHSQGSARIRSGRLKTG